jgi:hypothetical protein
MLERDLEYDRQVALRLVLSWGSRPCSSFTLNTGYLDSLIPGDSSSATQGNWQESQHDIHNA